MEDRIIRNKLNEHWHNMKSRCDNPKAGSYERYGAKGITYCKEWKDFEKFYKWAIANGFEVGLSLDRINPKGNYEPSNCRWIPLSENCRDKSNTMWIEYNGKKQTAGQWAKEVRINETTIIMRIKEYGWTPEEALTVMPGESRKQKMLDRVRLKLTEINDEVTELKYDDSRDVARLRFSTGYIRNFKITGMTSDEILTEISHYLTNGEENE